MNRSASVVKPLITRAELELAYGGMKGPSLNATPISRRFSETNSGTFLGSGLTSPAPMEPFIVGLDYRPALSRMTGVGRYVSGLAGGLARIDSSNRYILFTSSLRERPVQASRPPNFELVDRRLPVRILNLLWNRLEAPTLDFLTGADIDVTHSPTPLIVPSRRGRAVVTVHDLYFLKRPEHTTAEIRRDYVALVHEHTGRADAVVCVSDATAGDVIEELEVSPDRVFVIPNGIDERFLAPSDDDGAFAHLPSDFLLAVATEEPRKNLPALLHAVQVLAERGWDGRLVLAGGAGIDSPRITRAVEQRGLGGKVSRLGYVPPDELPGLYRRARAFVMPSLWEGFGLPLLEAMACDVPVVASDIPAHREVAGEAAVFVRPDDVESMADAIDKVWSSESLREQLVAEGHHRVDQFSWEATARHTLDVYESLTGAR